MYTYHSIYENKLWLLDKIRVKCIQYLRKESINLENGQSLCYLTENCYLEETNIQMLKHHPASVIARGAKNGEV